MNRLTQAILFLCKAKRITSAMSAAALASLRRTMGSAYSFQLSLHTFLSSNLVSYLSIAKLLGLELDIVVSENISPFKVVYIKLSDNT